MTMLIGNEVYTASSPSEISPITNALKTDIIGTLKSFNTALASMLEEYADPDSETVTIDGIEYDKYTAGTQLLLNSKLEEIENVQSTLLNIVNIMFQLDKSAGQIGAGG